MSAGAVISIGSEIIKILKGRDDVEEIGVREKGRGMGGGGCWDQYLGTLVKPPPCEGSQYTRTFHVNFHSTNYSRGPPSRLAASRDQSPRNVEGEKGKVEKNDAFSDPNNKKKKKSIYYIYYSRSQLTECLWYLFYFPFFFFFLFAF